MAQSSEILAGTALSASVLESYRLLREECGLVALSEFKTAVILTGEDRKGWLQGQATNDLRELHPGRRTDFCLCTPMGRLEAICGLWSLNDRLAVVTDIAGADCLLDRAKRMVVLEDVKAEVAEGHLFSVQGPKSTEALSEWLDLPVLEAGTAETKSGEVLCLRANRTGFGGWDIVVPDSEKSLLKKLRTEIPAVEPEAFWIAQLEVGSPRFGIDTDDKTLLPELGSQFESAHISYSKGCYVGQEVLMRIHSRGHTNRTWMGLIADGPMEPGDSVYGGTREVGKVTSAYESPEFGFIAGAYMQNSVASEGNVVAVETRRGAMQADVYSMPLLRFG